MSVCVCHACMGMWYLRWRTQGFTGMRVELPLAALQAMNGGRNILGKDGSDREQALVVSVLFKITGPCLVGQPHFSVNVKCGGPTVSK